MSLPKVSAIIPVYNGEKTLGRCLDSILDQTYGNFEIIVVDNHSTDSTRDIIKTFQEKRRRVKYVFEPKRGRGAARNAGIGMATGEIIVMTDVDCVVPRNWIEEITRPIIYEDEDAAMGFERALTVNYWTGNVQKVNWDFFQRSRRGKYVVNLDTKNFAIKASLMKKMMFDPAMERQEDVELAVRSRKVLKIRFMPSVVVGHEHKSSFSDIVKLNLDRAYWTAKIFKKHKNNLNPDDSIMTESISVKNFLLFPFWMILQFVQRPAGEAFFILVSEVSWRAGIVWSVLR